MGYGRHGGGGFGGHHSYGMNHHRGGGMSGMQMIDLSGFGMMNGMMNGTYTCSGNPVQLQTRM